jgi:hypothetical protein
MYCMSAVSEMYRWTTDCSKGDRFAQSPAKSIVGLVEDGRASFLPVDTKIVKSRSQNRTKCEQNVCERVYSVTA